MNYLTLRVSLYYLYILCIAHAVIKLTLATLAWSMLNAIAADDASQSTPVQITYVLMCCFT